MKTSLRWTLLALLVIALIIIPFLLFGAAIEDWVHAFVEHSRNRPAAAGLVLTGLLAGDVFLPTPSSIISTACGLLLGFPLGTLASTLGMQISCTLGYLLGVRAARPIVDRWIGQANAEKLDHLMQRYGLWSVIITRPIPVLAEAMTLFAGLGRLSPWRFFALSALANLGISALYAWVGSKGASTAGLLATLTAAILLPALAMLIHHLITRKR